MILDKTAEFSDSQVITGTAVSANIVDLNPSNKNPIVDIGAGEDISLGLQVDAAFVGSGTLVITLETDSAPSLAVAPVVILTTASFAAATLVSGYQIGIFKLPLATYKRYMGCRYTVSGTFTGGSLSAFVVRDAQTKRQYASGFTV